MLPGFVDGHGHFPGQGELDLFQANLNSPPIGTMTSIKDYIPVLAALAAQTEEGKAVTGKGFDDTLVTEKSYPTKEDLDEASTKHPYGKKSRWMGFYRCLRRNRSDGPSERGNTE